MKKITDSKVLKEIGGKRKPEKVEIDFSRALTLKASDLDNKCFQPPELTKEKLDRIRNGCYDEDFNDLENTFNKQEKK